MNRATWTCSSSCLQVSSRRPTFICARGAACGTSRFPRTSSCARREAAARLTPYATEFRYPGGPMTPTPDEFAQALADAEGLYAFVVSVLPAPVRPAG